MADLVLVDPERLVDHLLALGLVGLRLDHRRELVDLRIAVAAEVERAQLVLAAPARHQRRDGVVAVEGGRGPPEQEEAGVVAVLGEHLAEVLRLGLREESHLDPDLGEHRGYRLADPLVVDVAVVGAVHGDLEAVRIAGLGEQLLRPRDVVR